MLRATLIETAAVLALFAFISATFLIALGFAGI